MGAGQLMSQFGLSNTETFDLLLLVLKKVLNYQMSYLINPLNMPPLNSNKVALSAQEKKFTILAMEQKAVRIT